MALLQVGALTKARMGLLIGLPEHLTHPAGPVCLTMLPKCLKFPMALQLTVTEWPCIFRRCLSFRGSMRPLPELPESPEPLVPLAKELVTAKRARRGR